MAPNSQCNLDAQSKTKGNKKSAKNWKSYKKKPGMKKSKKQPRLRGVMCPICFADMKKGEMSATMCGHVFCTACLKGALSQNSECPICRTKVRKNGYHKIYL